MESWLAQLIASMVGVPEGEWDQRCLRALTIISSHATPFTPNTMRSCKQGYMNAKELPSMSRKNRADSVSTSSTTPASDASSSPGLITIHRVEQEPSEGDWFQVQSWRKDDSDYSFMRNNERAWRNWGLGSKTLDGVMTSYVDAKEVYAKVRIVKTTKTVITEDDLS